MLQHGWTWVHKWNKPVVKWQVEFPGGSVVKNPPASAGDTSLIPELGRFPGEKIDNPL